MAQKVNNDDSIHPKEDELIEEMLNLAFQTKNGANMNWKNSANTNGVVLDVTTDQCFKEFNKNEADIKGLQIVRGDTTVSGITPQIFFEWNEGFQDSHIVWEKEFEEKCTVSKVVQYIDKEHTIGYTAYAPGYFVSPRDFLYVKTRRFFKNYKVSENVVYKEVAVSFYYDLPKTNKHWIEAPKKHVRAYSIGGHVFCQKDEQSPVRLLFVSRMNLSGWIPLWLVNLAIGSKAESVSELKKNMNIVVDREMKKRKKLKNEEQEKNNEQEEEDEEKENEK